MKKLLLKIYLWVRTKIFGIMQKETTAKAYNILLSMRGEILSSLLMLVNEKDDDFSNVLTHDDGVLTLEFGPYKVVLEAIIKPFVRVIWINTTINGKLIEDLFMIGGINGVIQCHNGTTFQATNFANESHALIMKFLEAEEKREMDELNSQP